ALDEMKVLAGALEFGLGAEIGDVDDQRVAFPVATRVAPPQTDGLREMRAPIDGDRAVPALSLPRVVKDRDRVWRLHNPAEAGEIRQDRRHAPLAEAPLFRAVGAVDVSTTRNQVGRRVVLERLGSPGRCLRVVLSALASAQFVLASAGGLHEPEGELRPFLLSLQYLRGERRQAAVRRIHDQRRATARVLSKLEDRIVGTGQILLRSTLRARLVAG